MSWARKESRVGLGLGKRVGIPRVADEEETSRTGR